ncbi:MAG: hypothetical protein V4723_11810 [Pseudomonadota bacterium]
MSSIVSWIQRIFGTPALSEDHLGGAIDLSDAAYCLGLLAQSDE